MRSQVRIAISGRTLHSTIDRVIKQSRGKKMERGFGLRLINILSLTSATAMIERSQYRQCRKPRSHIICIRAEGTGGRAIRPAGQVEESRNRGGEIAKAGKLGHRSGLSHEA